MQLTDDGGLADPRVSGNKNELRLAPGYNTIEGSEPGIDFGFPPIQFLWNQQPVWRVVVAEREFVDAALSFPFSETPPKITPGACRCLIAFLSSLGEQLHNDSRYGARHIFSPLGRRPGLFGYVAMYPLHRIGCREGQSAGQYFVQRDPEGIEITA